MSKQSPTQASLSATLESQAGDISSPVHAYDGQDLMLEHVQARTTTEGTPGGNNSGHRGSLGSMRMTRQRSLRTNSMRGGDGCPSPTAGMSPRSSVMNGGQGGGGMIISKTAQAAQVEKHAIDAKFVEKDVESNFLTESHFYRGFYYMMAGAGETNELAANLREELFPQLALALEAVLHDGVREQLDKEVKQRKQQQHILGASHGSVNSTSAMHHSTHSFHHTPGHGSLSDKNKSLRQHPTYPSQPLRTSTTAVHPIIMLAKELKKRSKTYQRENPPKPTPPPVDASLAPSDESFALSSGAEYGSESPEEPSSPCILPASLANMNLNHTKGGSVNMQGTVNLSQTRADLGETLAGA